MPERNAPSPPTRCVLGEDPSDAQQRMIVMVAAFDSETTALIIEDHPSTGRGAAATLTPRAMRDLAEWLLNAAVHIEADQP